MSDRRAFLLCLALVAAYLGQEYALGRNSYVRINDHLDGIVPLYVTLADGEPILGGLEDRVDALFGGLPRNSMPSTIHLGVLSYYALDPFWAHVSNDAVLHLVALVGMFLLLRRHLLPEASPALIGGASVCFALLPFLPLGYLSIAGQPLLLHTILNLRKGRAGAGDWAFIALFPLYSSLAFVGIFLLLGLGVLFVHDWVHRRTFPVALFLAGLLMGALFAASEYRLLYQALLDPDYHSHRSEFVRSQGSLLHVIRVTLRSFFLEDHHARSMQSPFLLLGVAGGLGLGLDEIRRLRGSLALREILGAARRGVAPGSRWRDLLIVTALAATAALIVGLWGWSLVQSAVEHSGPFRIFNFHRIQWFQPLLFGLAFAFALHEIVRIRPGTRVVIGALVGIQLLFVVYNSHGFVEKRATGLSFAGYYSTPLFQEIRDHIGRPQNSYHVVSLGITPGIALYNGFRVLDGFVNDYPLEYKHRFRRVIAAELDKDAFLRRIFDDWGGHVDLFTSELGKVSGYKHHSYTKLASRRSVEHLDIDVAALQALGADYLLSSVEIRNHEKLGLVWERTFAREDSPWEIFLYAVGTNG